MRRGGVIAFPTETFYALGTDALNPEAVERVYRLKGRDPGKPILILVSEMKRIAPLVEEVPSVAHRLMSCFWPGPLTIIFNASPLLPPLLHGETGKIGIRIPGHPVALALLAIGHFPVTGTSANLSGGLSPTTAEQVRRSFPTGLDLIIDGGETPGEQGSTLIDVTSGQVRLVREGKISWEEIERQMR